MSGDIVMTEVLNYNDIVPHISKASSMAHFGF